MTHRPERIASIRAVAESLQQERKQLEYCFAADLGDVVKAPDELVRGIITHGSLAVYYGDSNSGKTFLALSMVSALCIGEQWMGRETEPCLVVYLASEGPQSVRMRLQAYQKHRGRTVPNLAVVASPIDLYASDADALAVVRLVRELETLTGTKCDLIVGDTLARLSAGANENSGEDMGVVLRHIDTIRDATGAAFLLIHHTGKDAARGMRGWSGLRAAVDTEVEITADEMTGIRTAEITKQRDLSTKGDRIGFRLTQVQMGLSKWGAPITSCVVEAADAPAKSKPARRMSEIAGAITETLTTRGSGMRKGDLVKHFAGRHTSSAVYRELKNLIEGGKAHEVAGIVALVKS
jgi:RecA-family ATPase